MYSKAAHGKLGKTVKVNKNETIKTHKTLKNKIFEYKGRAWPAFRAKKAIVLNNSFQVEIKKAGQDLSFVYENSLVYKSAGKRWWPQDFLSIWPARHIDIDEKMNGCRLLGNTDERGEYEVWFIERADHKLALQLLDAKPTITDIEERLKI